MTKHLAYWLLTAQIILTSSCGIEFEKIPDDVQRGPDNSFYAGGLDGGVFVKMAKSDHGEQLYHGTLYHQDGQLLYTGPFRYSEPGKTFDPADPAVYSGWDGERLYLMDNTFLTPTEAISPL